MTINNPGYGIRIIDLIDTSGYKYFDYFEIYEIVHLWLDNLRPFFYNESEWNRFIERFTDRYYMRWLNFDTYLDAKIQIKVVLENLKEQAENLEQIKLKDLDLINDYHRFSKITDAGTSKNLSTTTQEGSEKNNAESNSKAVMQSLVESKNQENSSDTSYNLYSDTPSNTVNLDNMISKNNNYITNATNDKNTHSGSNSNSSNSDTTNTSSDSSNSSRLTATDSTSSANDEYSKVHQEDISETHGDYLDFIEKYKSISTDIINFYLDKIEDAQIFNCVLY